MSKTQAAQHATGPAECVELAPTHGKYSLLGPGQVIPDGFLEQWGLLNADAWLLMQAHGKDPEVYGTFWNRFREVKHFWDTAPDYTSYLGDSLVRYAQLFPRARLAREVRPWLRRLLASQDKDGYLGAFAKPARWKMALEIFTMALMMEVLLYRYRSTGDRKLLRAAQRSAGHIMDHWRRGGRRPSGLAIYSGHGAILVRPMLGLYATTGRREYLKFAREQMNKAGRQQAYLAYYKAARRAKALEKSVTYDVCGNQHNAVECEHVGLPAILYEYDGDPKLLAASQAAWMMMQNHLSVDGTPHGNEGMVRTGPRENSEHCGAVEWLFTNHALVRTAGGVQYADAVELAMYNGYPSAKTPDGMMVAYMHMPNQLVASQWSKPQFDDVDRLHSAQYYSTGHWPLCCNVNGPRAIPQFVESMVLRSATGLAVAYYGPCQVRTALPEAGEVLLRMDTRYPFEDQVRIEVSPRRPATFTLELRVPGWCKSASVEVNGKTLARKPAPGKFLAIRRVWRTGDTVGLRFEIPIRLECFAATGIREAGYAVRRGPLLFALPVKPRWEKIRKPWKKGPGKNVQSYQLLPAADWNYALVVDKAHPDKSFTLERLAVPKGSQPWQDPPVGLKVAARRVLNWQLDGSKDHPLTPGLPFVPMELSRGRKTITLVPYGFTRLRMSFLPIVRS